MFPHLFQDDSKLALTENQIGTIEKGTRMSPGIYAFVAKTGDQRADIEGDITGKCMERHDRIINLAKDPSRGVWLASRKKGEIY